LKRKEKIVKKKKLAKEKETQSKIRKMRLSANRDPGMEKRREGPKKKRAGSESGRGLCRQCFVGVQ